MKDKKHIELILKAFAYGNISVEQAVESILSVFSDSKRVHYFSLVLGMFLGIVIFAIKELFL